MLPQQPVILTGTDLVAPSLRWSLSYLEENIGTAKHTVFLSKTRQFLYFDDKKVGVVIGRKKKMEGNKSSHHAAHS